MKKKLSAGVLLVLGSLGVLQVQAQAVVNDPPLTIQTAIEFVKQQYRFLETRYEETLSKARDIQRLQTELAQLQIAVNNAKRASPELWDSSLNIFENLSNSADQADTLLNASKDVQAALKRAGCLNGAIQGIDGGVLVEPNAAVRPEQQVAARERIEQESRCRQMAATLTAKDKIKQVTRGQQELAEKMRDGEAGSNQIAEVVANGIAQMNAAILQGQLAAQETEEVKRKQEAAILEQQRSMHDRLMKAPSSSKKINARNPELTVDPNDY